MSSAKDVDIPLGVLVVITGVAGSGKSSLVHESIPAEEGVVSIDRARSGARDEATRRRTPACSTRSARLAKANGVKPVLFSANSEGACPNCAGAGVIYTDLAMITGDHLAAYVGT